MKTFPISVILIMMTLLFLPESNSAKGNEQTTVCLNKQQHAKHDQVLDEKGHRMPGHSLFSTISEEEGISIPSVNNDDILLYEVADTEGNTLVEFTDEYEFVSYVLSLNQNCEIIIHLDDYILVGFISK